jgi:hypothetical protein
MSREEERGVLVFFLDDLLTIMENKKNNRCYIVVAGVV